MSTWLSLTVLITIITRTIICQLSHPAAHFSPHKSWSCATFPKREDKTEKARIHRFSIIFEEASHWISHLSWVSPSGFMHAPSILHPPDKHASLNHCADIYRHGRRDKTELSGADLSAPNAFSARRRLASPLFVCVGPCLACLLTGLCKYICKWIYLKILVVEVAPARPRPKYSTQ